MENNIDTDPKPISPSKFMGKNTDTDKDTNTKTAPYQKSPSDGSGFFGVFGIIAAAIGLYMIFSPAEIVGGAAYNYIIGATKGTAVICTGIVLSLFGVIIKK